MTPKYCPSCGHGPQNATANFCVSCGQSLNTLTKTSKASVPRQLDDDDGESSNASFVPDIDEIEAAISISGPVEFGGFNTVSSFSFSPNGTASQKVFKPRKLNA